MSRTSAIVDREMRRQGFVSAAVIATQYGMSRSQLLDYVLQGKIRPAKPDGSAVFYGNWEDCIKTLGTPTEYRARPKTAIATPVSPEEPETLLPGMIPAGELEDIYRQEATAKAAAKAKSGVQPNTQQRVVIRPAEFAPDAAKK